MRSKRNYQNALELLELLVGPAHEPAGSLDPRRVAERGEALILWAHLAGELRLQAGQNVVKVCGAQALVAVAKDGEADGDVRVGKLRGRGGHVLAHKRDGELDAGLGHARVELLELSHVRGQHDAKGHTVDLLQAVREEGREPVVGQVEQLHLLRAEVGCQMLVQCRVAARPRLKQKLQDLIAHNVCAAHMLLLKPQNGPLRGKKKARAKRDERVGSGRNGVTKNREGGG